MSKKINGYHYVIKHMMSKLDSDIESVKEIIPKKYKNNSLPKEAMCDLSYNIGRRDAKIHDRNVLQILLDNLHEEISDAYAKDPLSEITYDEYGDTKTEVIDEYGDKVEVNK
tara:strand:+ start:361 stop:696 length:336 start_codon:yes stop_codon:yes gene_type:complete